MIIDRKKKLADWFKKISKLIPLLLLVILGAILVSLTSSNLLIYILCSGLVAIAVGQIGRSIQLPKHLLIFVQFLVVTVIFSGLWLGYFTEPAQAQFFKKAEDFFQNTLTQGSTTTDSTRNAVSLVFNVLRAIYLLYIAGSLIGVINAVRKDEDWQSIARIPLIVVIAVTVADVLTSFIVGDQSK